MTEGKSAQLLHHLLVELIPINGLVAVPEVLVMVPRLGDGDDVISHFYQFPLTALPGGPDSPEDENDHHGSQGGLDHPGLGMLSHEVKHLSPSPFPFPEAYYGRTFGKKARTFCA